MRDFREGAPVVGRYRGVLALGRVLRGMTTWPRIQVGLVTGNYFEVMGLSPVLGRVTAPSDDGPACHR